MIWTPEHIERLTILWLEGKSASVIAHEFGGDCTRNSVIGKVHRLNIQRNPTALAIVSQRHAPLPKRKESAMPLNVRVSKPMPRPIPPPVNVKPVRVAIACAPASGILSTFDLKDYHCRWPIGDPREVGFHYCGADSPLGRSYCDHHQSIAWETHLQRKARIAAERAEKEAA